MSRKMLQPERLQTTIYEYGECTRTLRAE